MAKRKHVALASATGISPTATTKRRRTSGGSGRNAEPTPAPPSSLRMHGEPTGPAVQAMGDPHPDGFTSTELAEACEALHSTLKCAKGGKRQYGKRTKMDNDGRPVDYLRMSKSCHFTTFAGNEAILEAMEPFIVSELHAAPEEERRFASVGRPTTCSEACGGSSRVSQLEEEIRTLKQGVGSPRSAQELELRAPAINAREEHLHDKEEELKRKEDEFKSWRKIAGVQKLEEDRRRLEDETNEKRKQERRCRDAMQQQQDLNDAWKQEQSAIQKELQRLVQCLEEQKKSNGYAPNSDGWKQRFAVEQEVKRAAQAALEEALREAADFRNAITELKLRLASYVAGAAAEHDIELFAKRFAVPPHDDISSRFKQRVFTVNMMKRIQNARGIELDADIYNFSQQRNQLCHDYTGTNAISIPHEDFQALCSKIRAAMRDLHAAYSQ
ncbi:hypothetical protein PHYSODRAFT_327915 [Phytophthora sojae]|uniref:Uncharacterized protein n=1 Tax=Phytophthora sojae (strain P6497) TaxID=1094619 RepID=G4Z8V0_PHYSP|nr:hypothetical protein PHYSODRAFT_327915 [Phytophthora sojae]EGZ19721.1 hypothetical protein PHYSODRAFT_327915 [Phytophthora sojae]|eukprot:XP_009522438.1 hypothetical protein PHYSODRAFT_327915 [Phytophthora sojae]